MNRKFIWLVFPPILLIGLIAWRIHVHFDADFIKGHNIRLLDHIRPEFIVKSALADFIQEMKKEPIKVKWERLEARKSVSVWRTFIGSRIVIESGTNSSQLFEGTKALIREPDVFKFNAEPGRWNFHQNQIWITTPGNVNPNDTHYFLSAHTVRSPHTKRIQGEIVRELWSMEIGRSKKKRRFTVLPLQYPIFIETLDQLSSKLSVMRDDQKLLPSEWQRFSESEPPVHEEVFREPLKLVSGANGFETVFYSRTAPLLLNVTAKKQFGGSKSATLVVYLNERRAGSIQIHNPEDAVYRLDLMVRTGKNRLKIGYENPKDTSENEPIILIREMAIRFQNAIAIIETAGANKGNPEYRVDYSTLQMDSSQFYRDFLISGEQVKDLSGITGAVTLKEDLRRSLLTSGEDRIEFPIEVPEKGTLHFGYGAWRSREECKCRIAVQVNQPFRLPVTVFSGDAGRTGIWQEAQADLSKFAGKRIRLTFNIDGNGSKNCPVLFFLSHPEVLNEGPSQPLQQIILISFDSLRADHLGIFGHHRSTSPGIDTFARDAVVFENAMTPATWTLPSYSSLFTSLYPAYHKTVEGNRLFSPTVRTLPTLLQQNGYHTAGFVESPFLYPDYGFSKGFDSYNYQTVKIHQRADLLSQWLDRYGTRKQFLFLHFLHPHYPYSALNGFVERLDRETSKEIDPSLDVKFHQAFTECTPLGGKELEAIKLQYDGKILEADALFGALLKKLKQLGIYDNALIVVTSDHGEEFLEHGNLQHGSSVFQEQARVPLIIKFPKSFSAIRGRRIKQRVLLIDVMPTILDLLKIKPPPEIQGASLMPLVSNHDSRHFDNRTIFIESGNTLIAILEGRYKYIYPQLIPTPRSCRQYRSEELYDLEADPREVYDLSQKMPDIIKNFRKKLTQFKADSTRFGKETAVRTVTPDPDVEEKLRALGYID